MNSPIRNILKTQISNLTGFEFQDLIDRLFLAHHGKFGYVPTRKTRDLGCDGIINNDTVIACYGYVKAEKSDILKKVEEDFRKYDENWSTDFSSWLFIINKEVPSYLIAEIEKLKPDSLPIGIDQLIELIESDLSASSKLDIYEYLKIPKEYYIYLTQEFWSLVESVKPQTNNVIRVDRDIKRKFHSIVPLTWNYIAHQADTKRDLYLEIMDLLKTENGSTPKFISITGQPLSGKSTLMRRIGYDLASEAKTVLHVHKGDNQPAIWKNLARYYEIVNRKVFLLIDDIFENDSAFRAMMRFLEEDIKQKYDIIILSTAVSNDRLKRRLGDIERIEVPVHASELQFTENEKRQILKNVDIDELSIGSRVYERLVAVNKFYSFLMHISFISQDKTGLAAGIHSESVEEWRIKDLKKHQLRLFEAYKYICFAHKHKLSIPASLIQRVEGSSFSDVLELRGRHNWIFDVKDKYSKILSLESAHWYLAEIYWDVYVQFVSPRVLITEIVASASPDNYPDAVFVVHLFRVITEDNPKWDLTSILIGQSVKIKRLYSTLGVDSMCIWSRIYKTLKMVKQQAECLDEAKKKEPINVADLRVLIPLIEDADPERALRLLHNWLKTEPTNGALRVAYFEFLSRTADRFPDEITTVINQYARWLENAGDLWDSTQTYIDFIIEHSPKNDPLNLDEITSFLNKWITQNHNHPNSSSIWASYIKLIKYYCNETMMVYTLGDCWEWLIDHQEERGFTFLMPLFISELNRWGTPEKNKEVLKYLMNWIKQHPKVDQIRAEVLKLIGGKWATKTERETVLGQLASQLKEIHHGITVCNIISLIRIIRYTKQISETINDLFDWLQVPLHNKEHNVRAGFIKLVGDFGTPKQAELAISNTSNWLNKNKGEIVFVAYIALVERKCNYEVKQNLIKQLNKRFEHLEHMQENVIRCKYLTLVLNCGKDDQVKACINQTLSWWGEYFDQNVIASLLTLLEKRNNQQLQSAMNKVKRQLSKYPNKFLILREKINSIERKYYVR